MAFTCGVDSDGSSIGCLLAILSKKPQTVLALGSLLLGMVRTESAWARCETDPDNDLFQPLRDELIETHGFAVILVSNSEFDRRNLVRSKVPPIVRWLPGEVGPPGPTKAGSATQEDEVERVKDLTTPPRSSPVPEPGDAADAFTTACSEGFALSSASSAASASEAAWRTCQKSTSSCLEPPSKRLLSHFPMSQMFRWSETSLLGIPFCRAATPSPLIFLQPSKSRDRFSRSTGKCCASAATPASPIFVHSWKPRSRVRKDFVKPRASSLRATLPISLQPQKLSSRVSKPRSLGRRAPSTAMLSPVIVKQSSGFLRIPT
mmetsp:Transcript_130491/g.278819  ORF Transcript_130491/g.278819 Transcript_130491/m.278819 type:complete len:319 (-) Transcript_130491:2363-3319(-)